MNQSELAIQYIVSYCKDIGVYSGTPEVDEFLKQAVADIDSSESNDVFPDSIKKQVSYSVNKILMRGFLSSEVAIASEYLSKQFIHYFCILSGLFTGEDEWSDAEAKVHAERLLGTRLDDRMEDIVLAYTLFKRNLSSVTANYFHALDLELYAKPVTMSDNKTLVSSIGDRIDWIRNRASQGSVLDCASESMFFCLLTTLVFYSAKEDE